MTTTIRAAATAVLVALALTVAALALPEAAPADNTTRTNTVGSYR